MSGSAYQAPDLKDLNLGRVIEGFGNEGLGNEGFGKDLISRCSAHPQPL